MSRVTNEHLPAAQEIWEEKWQAEHANWQPPHEAYGSLAVGKDPSGGSLELFVQHQKPEAGSSARLFAVDLETVEALTIQYDAQKDEAKVNDPFAILARTDLSQEWQQGVFRGMSLGLQRSKDYADKQEKPSQVDGLTARDTARKASGQTR